MTSLRALRLSYRSRSFTVSEGRQIFPSTPLRALILVVGPLLLLLSALSINRIGAAAAPLFVAAAAFAPVKQGRTLIEPISMPNLRSTNIRYEASKVSTAIMAEPKSSKDCATKEMANIKKKCLYSFTEARKIARTYGFTKQEFIDYDCPGAYQLPKNPDEVWSEEWKGWDDFLGVTLGFEEGRVVARRLAKDFGIKDEEEYLALMKDSKAKIEEDNLAIRLPFRPDLYYKKEWEGWHDWLGC